MSDPIGKDFRRSDADLFDVPGEVERSHNAALGVIFLVARTNYSMRAVPPEFDPETGKALPAIPAGELNISDATRDLILSDVGRTKLKQTLVIVSEQDQEVLVYQR